MKCARLLLSDRGGSKQRRSRAVASFARPTDIRTAEVIENDARGITLGWIYNVEVCGAVTDYLTKAWQDLAQDTLLLPQYVLPWPVANDSIAQDVVHPSMHRLVAEI